MKAIKINSIYLFFFLAIFTTGCCVDGEDVKDFAVDQLLGDGDNSPSHSGCVWDCDTSNLVVVWQHPIQKDSSRAEVKEIIFDGSNIYYNGCFTTVYARDAQYGEVLWEWNDYHPKSRGNGATDIANSETTLFINAHDETHAVEKISGQNNWVYSTMDDGGGGDSRISTGDEKVFHIHIPDCQSHFKETYLVTANTNQLKANLPQWDTLCSFFAEKDKFVFAETPKVWLSPYNETILLTTVQHWSINGIDDHTDLIAYNLTQRDTQFVIQEIVPDAVGRPDFAIHNNHAAILFPSGLAYVDLITEKRKWLKSASGTNHFNRYKMYLNDEVIIVNQRQQTCAFETHSGNLKWKNTELGGTYFYEEYNGKVIGSNSNIVAVDMRTGEVTLDEGSPNIFSFASANFYNQGLTVDTQNGLIYTSDNRFIQCIKIPF